MSEHPTQRQLVLYATGDAAEPDGVEAHVSECDPCARQIDEVRRLLEAARGTEVPEPGADFESRIWARVRSELDPALFRPTGTAAASTEHRTRGVPESMAADDGPGPGRMARFLEWMTPRRMLLAGSVAALVAVAFLVGLLLPPPAASPLAPADDGVRERILLVAVGDHLQRSQTILVELVNAEAEGTFDARGQQQRARSLLVDNRLYRQSARLGGQAAVADLLGELERVLLEVAHGPDELPAEDLAWLRERITSRDLLFRVRVVEETARREEIESTADRSVG